MRNRSSGSDGTNVDQTNFTEQVDQVDIAVQNICLNGKIKSNSADQIYT